MSARAERKRARKADEATRYAGDSAGALTYGVIALLVAGAFLGAPEPTGFQALAGLILGVSGLIGLGQGIHALASNLDRVMRARMRPPT